MQRQSITSTSLDEPSIGTFVRSTNPEGAEAFRPLNQGAQKKGALAPGPRSCATTRISSPGISPNLHHATPIDHKHLTRRTEHWNIRAKHEPGGSRGLQASESRGPKKGGFSPGPSFLRHNTHLVARNLSELASCNANRSQAPHSTNRALEHSCEARTRREQRPSGL